MTIAGHRVLTPYEGQPLTCYGCGAIGHMYHACPTSVERIRTWIPALRLTKPLRRIKHRRGRRARKTGQTEPKPRNRQTWRRNQWWKQTNRHRQTTHIWVNDTTDQQTPQYPRLSLQGDSTEITTRQQAVEEQDLGDTMEGGETIPESTPLHEQRSPMSQNPKEEEISTNKNVSMRHKAENKAGLSPEEADIEMVQIDEKGNRRDKT